MFVFNIGKGETDSSEIYRAYTSARESAEHGDRHELQAGATAAGEGGRAEQQDHRRGVAETGCAGLEALVIHVVNSCECSLKMVQTASLYYAQCVRVGVWQCSLTV